MSPCRRQIDPGKMAADCDSPNHMVSPVATLVLDMMEVSIGNSLAWFGLCTHTHLLVMYLEA